MAFLRSAIETLTDPVVMARVKLLQAEADGTLEWAERFAPVEGYERAPERGTCPTCLKTYTFAGDLGGLRRHGKGKCALDTQMAEELIPAVFLIAELGDKEGAESDDGTHAADSNHV